MVLDSIPSAYGILALLEDFFFWIYERPRRYVTAASLKPRRRTTGCGEVRSHLVQVCLDVTLAGGQHNGIVDHSWMT